MRKNDIIFGFVLVIISIAGCQSNTNGLPERENMWFADGDPIWYPLKYIPKLNKMSILQLTDSLGEPDVVKSSRSQLMERWNELPATLDAALKGSPRAEVYEYRWTLPQGSNNGADHLFVVAIKDQLAWGVAYSSQYYDL